MLISWAVAAVIATAAAAANGLVPDELELADMATDEERRGEAAEETEGSVGEWYHERV